MYLSIFVDEKKDHRIYFLIKLQTVKLIQFMILRKIKDRQINEFANHKKGFFLPEFTVKWKLKEKKFRSLHANCVVKKLMTTIGIICEIEFRVYTFEGFLRTT